MNALTTSPSHEYFAPMFDIVCDGGTKKVSNATYACSTNSSDKQSLFVYVSGRPCVSVNEVSFRCFIDIVCLDYLLLGGQYITRSLYSVLGSTLSKFVFNVVCSLCCTQTFPPPSLPSPLILYRVLFFDIRMVFLGHFPGKYLWQIANAKASPCHGNTTAYVAQIIIIIFLFLVKYACT